MKNNNKLNEYFVNSQKIKYLDVQLLATFGFIIALFLSFILSYDKKLVLQNKKRLFNNKDAQNVAVFQTILVFLIAIGFLYSNYEQYKLSKKVHSNDEQDLLLQIETSIFAIISALIGLYIVFKNYNRQLKISETETF